MARYSHVFELAFSCESDKKDGSDVTGEMLWEALCHRLKGEGPETILEVCGLPMAGETVEA